MMKSVSMLVEHFLLRLLLLLLFTPTIVISIDEPSNDLALIVNDDQRQTNITCLCTSDEECNPDGKTCTLTQAHHTCYESWTLDPVDSSIRVTAGCMLNDYFFVRLMCDRNETKRYVVCCSNRDFCNDLDAYSAEIRTAMLPSPMDDILTKKPSRWSNTLILILTIVSTMILLLGLFSLVMFGYLKRTRGDRRDDYYPKSINYGTNEQSKQGFIQRLFKVLLRRSRSPSDIEGQIPTDQSLTHLLDELSTSTTGPALPLLMQRTLARQITLEQVIGAGRYGSVHRGKWREDFVAVKIFSASDERSWFREIDIYQTVCLRHENILGYIAADNMDASTHTQLWLVTEYHENGSIYDYLMNHTITIPILVKMMLSIASGLCHLHLPIDSTNGKVALAHRDIKTKNILVKKDLTCCIADLGLAVKEVRTPQKNRRALATANGKTDEDANVVIDILPNPRVGTIRYMAPEILDETINMQNFESFKAADMYALGLVFWEILRRCRTNPQENDADPYLIPYEGVTPGNPSSEQMRDAVCTRKLRPEPSERWQQHPVLRSISHMCEELWL